MDDERAERYTHHDPPLEKWWLRTDGRIVKVYIDYEWHTGTRTVSFSYIVHGMYRRRHGLALTQAQSALYDTWGEARDVLLEMATRRLTAAENQLAGARYRLDTVLAMTEQESESVE